MFFYSKQSGSVTMLGIIVMVFLGIVLAGLLPMLTNEVRLGPENRDGIEAQYAAEAGAKRAIVGFLNHDTNWGWLEQDIPVMDNKQETYHVTIQGIIPGQVPSKGTYTIESTGKVGKVVKTVNVIANVPKNGDGSAPVEPEYPGDCAVYSGGALSFHNNNIIQQASVASGGAFGYGNNFFILPPYSHYYKSLSLPDVNISSTGLPQPPTSSAVLTQNVYYQKGAWQLKNNVTLMGDAIIFVDGSIVAKNNISLLGNILLIATGSINFENNVDVNNGVIISYGAMSFGNNVVVNGAVMSRGSMSFFNNGSFTYNRDVITHFNLPVSDSGSAGGGGAVTIGNWSTR